MGSYAISPSGLTSSNYSIAYVPGVLTVGTPAPTAFTGSLSEALRATFFSVIDPLASAVSSTGSVIVQSGVAGFLNALSPTAAGNTVAEGTRPSGIEPTKRQGRNAGCFSRQPMSQLQC
jgi:hypothetical protein